MEPRIGSELTQSHICVLARNATAVIAPVILAATIVAAQDTPSALPTAIPGLSAIRPSGFNALTSLSSIAGTAGRPSQVSDFVAAGFPAAGYPAMRPPIRFGGPQSVTLEQVKQQSASRVASPLAYMSQLSVEAAKQHRLGVQADYFPKLGATFLNLHTTDFLGQVLRLPPGPLKDVPVQLMNGVPVQIINKDMTAAALTFVQPITPIFAVRQAVRIARADERIAMAKAAASVSKNARDTEVEETYFKLLIAQRQLISAESKLKGSERRPLYASASVGLASVSGGAAGTWEAAKAVETAAATVKELTASLNRLMGWAEDTQLELSIPDPLVENMSLREISDKSPAATASLVEAEQTVVKARAAVSISKMAYFPVVAAVGGYLFQNVLPAVNSNFGYGGVMASYTLFDFGKREHAIKEARAQLGMAETALQLTKAKLAADLRKSYSDLERSRQLSQVAHKMGSSAVLLMKVSSDPESLEVTAARADMEVEMLQADLAHRQAYNRLKAMTGSER
ncbi:MAG TPA: TolC family protein [Bryobacteraceae bacterium]|nr:TolC family protein [Bryobacteraceae bacterium]